MKKHIINAIIIIIISFVITLYFVGFSGNLESYLLNMIYGASIGLSFALGSALIAKYIINKSDLVQSPLKTYSVLLLSVVVFMGVDVVVVNWLWFELVYDMSLVQLLSSNFGSKIFLSEIFIGLLIFLVIVSFGFVKRFKTAQQEVSQAKEATVKFQYETLKNQINPHFLFNSLNALSALIHIDTDKADAFTNKLAQVYRYILDHQDDELVELNSELEFIEKYSYLLKIRFDNLFDIQIINHSKTEGQLLVSMALQIIIENVFKHNKISKTTPMVVSILIEDDYIKISNPLNLKDKKETSHGLGLSNIEKRYSLLTPKACKFGEENDTFYAIIPLLK